jgi:protein-S-isoprenylcysteine O-methyltransferase Ste14
MNIFRSPWNFLFFVGFIAYLAIRGYYGRRTKRLESVHRQVDGLEKMLMLLVIPTSSLTPVLYLFTPLLWFADYRLPAFAPWLGTSVMFLALWLFWRSHADLGENWSVSLEVRKHHNLVVDGVYRWIRHPMYAAIFLWSLAQGLLLSNWLAGWSSLATFSVMYFIRTPREERMMCEHFGKEYQDYMDRTGRLFPRLTGKRHRGDSAAECER